MLQSKNDSTEHDTPSFAPPSFAPPFHAEPAMSHAWTTSIQLVLFSLAISSLSLADSAVATTVSLDSSSQWVKAKGADAKEPDAKAADAKAADASSTAPRGPLAGQANRSIAQDGQPVANTVDEQKAESHATVPLDAVVVSSTREKRKRRKIDQSISLINENEIKNTAPTHPSEIMNRISGVHVNQVGGGRTHDVDPPTHHNWRAVSVSRGWNPHPPNRIFQPQCSL